MDAVATTDPENDGRSAVVPPPPRAVRRHVSRFRERSLLTNPSAVIAGSLAALAIAFGALTVRLASGHDPAVGFVAAVPRAGSSTGVGALTTRASAAAGSAARAGTSAGGAVSRAPALKTSSSGATASSGGASSTVTRIDDGA